MVLLVGALALFGASLLGVMPPGVLLGSFMLIAAALAFAMAAAESSG